jgi:two-component system response regulator RegA
VGDRSLLLVEDDEALRALVARHLRARGWVVAEAGSAEQVPAVLAASPSPSLILLDLNLPGDTGWDLLRHGPLAGPDAPPVVIVTATTIGPRRLREFGVAGYLPKPFALETLLEVCERFVARPAPQLGTTSTAEDRGEST